MAENKKSVLLYCDIIHTVEKLDNETAGQLFKHYLRYINDENPETSNLLVEIAFEGIKQNLKRDLKKWEDKAVKRSKSGTLGGIKSGESRRKKAELLKQNKANEPIGSNALKNKANEAVNVNANVKVSVNDNVITKKDQYPFEDFWNLYDKKSSNRKSCIGKWSRLSETKKTKIMLHLISYVKSTPEKEFRKNAETYLNQEHWQNEILEVEAKGRFPNNYDKEFERRLTGQSIIEYHNHLKSLGWKSHYHPVGGTTWRKNN